MDWWGCSLIGSELETENLLVDFLKYLEISVDSMLEDLCYRITDLNTKYLGHNCIFFCHGKADYVHIE